MVFHWILSDSKSPLVFRTPLSNLNDLNNAIVWMISAHPPISNSSNPFIRPLVIVPSTTITTEITVIDFCIDFFLVLREGSCICLSFCFPWFSLCGTWGQQSLLVSRFSLFLLKIAMSGLMVGIWWSISISKYPRNFLRFILQDRFWFIHIPSGSVFKKKIII